MNPAPHTGKMIALPPEPSDIRPSNMPTEKYPVHPACKIFPDASPEDYANMRESIRSRGLAVEIELLDGQIIDGKNRDRICRELGIEARYIDVELATMDAYDYSAILNRDRRHLTQCQKIIIAGHIKVHRDKINSNGQDNELAPTAHAAKIMGVSERAVSEAAKVVVKGCQTLVKKVESGEISLPKAVQIVEKTKTKWQQEDVLAREEKRKSKREVDNETADTTEVLDEAELAVEDRMEKWNASVESFARTISKLCDSIPEGEHMTSYSSETIKSYLKGAAGTARATKAYRLCDKCNADGCKACSKTGFLTRISWESMEHK